MEGDAIADVANPLELSSGERRTSRALPVPAREENLSEAAAVLAGETGDEQSS